MDAEEFISNYKLNRHRYLNQHLIDKENLKNLLIDVADKALKQGRKEIIEKLTNVADIDKLKKICDAIEKNYFDDDWKLSESQLDELFRITGFEDYKWEGENLAYFIDGMQRATKLIGD